MQVYSIISFKASCTTTWSIHLCLCWANNLICGSWISVHGAADYWRLLKQKWIHLMLNIALEVWTGSALSAVNFAWIETPSVTAEVSGVTVWKDSSWTKISSRLKKTTTGNTFTTILSRLTTVSQIWMQMKMKKRKTLIKMDGPTKTTSWVGHQ